MLLLFILTKHTFWGLRTKSYSNRRRYKNLLRNTIYQHKQTYMKVGDELYLKRVVTQHLVITLF